VPWPGPDPAELADGSLVISATTPRSGVVVIRAVGEIDLLTAPAWRRTLAAATWIAGSPTPPGPATTAHETPAGGRARRLVCDLSAVTFFAATGLNALVDLVAQADERGVELCVVADGYGSAGRLLALIGLDRRIERHRRLDDAVSPAPAGGVAS
jgi:anti-anti-sigma regulatory factor